MSRPFTRSKGRATAHVPTGESPHHRMKKIQEALGIASTTLRSKETSRYKSVNDNLRKILEKNKEILGSNEYLRTFVVQYIDDLRQEAQILESNRDQQAFNDTSFAADILKAILDEALPYFATSSSASDNTLKPLTPSTSTAPQLPVTPLISKQKGAEVSTATSSATKFNADIMTEIEMMDASIRDMIAKGDRSAAEKQLQTMYETVSHERDQQLYLDYLSYLEPLKRQIEEIKNTAPIKTEPVPQDTEMLAQQGQLQMPPAVPDVTGQQPSMPTDDRSVSQHVFVQESTHNQSYLDDSQLLANISSNYDSLNRPALAALGADISYRRERPVDTTNSFRENLYGPRVSGGDIRQLNRVADTDLIPLQQNVNIKLTQLRNDLVSFLDSFIEDPEPTSSDEYTRRPNDTYEYDPMEVQIPVDRESLMQQQAGATTNAQDDAVNPQAFGRSVLVPEEVDATFKMVQRGSGNYIVKKLRSAGLKNLVKPYSDYFSSVYDYMSVPTEDRLLVVKSSIQRMRSSMQSYQQKVGPYVFQGIVLSCAVTESAIDGLLYNSSQKQQALYQIKQYDAQMRQGVAPSKKSYAPY